MGEAVTGGLWASIGADGRDPRLADFASGGRMDGAFPSGRVLGRLESLASPYGPDDVPFAGATGDEAAGMLAAAQALEGHLAGLKLALVREVIRRHAPAVPGGRMPGPGSWDVGVLHEIAAILRISWQTAHGVADLAWQLEARLPGAGELLNLGVLSWLTAKIIAEEFSVLDDEKAAGAERRLLDHDLAADAMTPGAVRRLCQRIADGVDPGGAAKRREQKERDEARVTFARAHGGTAVMCASGLPPDEALKSWANIQKRALEYEKAGIREKMDFLRVLAWLDLINGVTVPQRHARWQSGQAERDRTGADDPGRRAWEAEQRDNANRDRHGDDAPFPDSEPGDLDDRDPGDGDGRDDDPDPDAPPFPGEEPGDIGDQPADGDGGVPSGGDNDGRADDDRNDGDDSPGGGTGPGGPGGAGTGPVPAGMPDPGLPSLVNLTLPLATILGQGERPGEAPGYGSVDPALARKLADAATASPRSGFCVTLTDPEGHAAAHGCARLIRGKRNKERNGQAGKGAGPPGGARDGPAANGWDFTRDETRPGPEGGYGAWILTLPGGRRYRVDMHKIPLHDCDHTYATDAYRPGDLLRHLVEVRDGECTFMGCSHPARLSDFEHAVPYHKGGKTDACNGGARSRRCHRVKQRPGWSVTQPEPGWHRWTTPSGRSYTKGPKRYPA
jgi:hypothetical protein